MKEESKKLNEEYLKASARMEEIKGFYTNIIAYVLVIPFLIFINYMTYWDYKWFWYPMIAWGVGVGIHALVTFGFGTGWEERKIKEIMEKDKNNL